MEYKDHFRRQVERTLALNMNNEDTAKALVRESLRACEYPYEKVDQIVRMIFEKSSGSAPETKITL